jgi:hypothetical protein
MFHQGSVTSGQDPGEPEPPRAGEELWEQELERLRASRAAVRTLPYAMVDKRFIRWVRVRVQVHSLSGAVGGGGELNTHLSDAGGNHEHWPMAPSA